MAKSTDQEMNKADNLPIQTQTDNGALQTGAPNPNEGNSDGVSVEELQAQIVEKDKLIAEKDEQIEALQAQIIGKDAEITKIKSQPSSAQSETQAFKVVREYCGISKGEIVYSESKPHIAHMVTEGYWEAQ